MAVGRTRQHSGADIWPGFVDALAALLIIVIFLLMVFTLAQYFLSEILSGARPGARPAQPGDRAAHRDAVARTGGEGRARGHAVGAQPPARHADRRARQAVEPARHADRRARQAVEPARGAAPRARQAERPGRGAHRRARRAQGHLREDRRRAGGRLQDDRRGPREDRAATAQHRQPRARHRRPARGPRRAGEEGRRARRHAAGPVAGKSPRCRARWRNGAGRPPR